jgi:hypothetical protein
VYGQRRMSVLGIDARQLRGVDPKHEGQYVREILQQMKPIRHLTRRGRPEARRFRVCLRTLPDEDLHPGMRLQALATVAASRSGSRARGRRRARSNRRVP